MYVSCEGHLDGMEEALGIPLDISEECFVYVLTCSTNGKHYVGISNDIDRRFKEHIRRSSGENTSHSKLSRAISKYGKDSFTVKEFLRGTRDFCCFMEVAVIGLYDSHENGYNSSQGGEGTSYHSPWNKGTKGLCKANKTTLVKGGKSPRQILTEEDKDRIKSEYASGIYPKYMTWLPVHWSQAYRIIKGMHC